MISLSDDIEPAPGVRRTPPTAGLDVTGGAGFGPRDVRLEGAGMPSETGALGFVGTGGLAEPVGVTARVGVIERVVVFTVSGAGDAGLRPVRADATAGLGGKDGLRVLAAVVADGAGRTFMVGLAEAIDVLGAVGLAIVVFEAGVAVVLEDFLRVEVAVAFEGALVALAALVMTEAVGLATLMV